MDLTTIVARAARRLEDTANAQWSTTVLTDYVNNAAEDFCRETRCFQKYSSALTETSGSSPDNGFYDLPSDCLQVLRVDNVAGKRELDRLCEDDLPADWATKTGTPYGWLYGPFGAATEKLLVYPVPSAALTNLRLWYVAKAATLSYASPGESPTGIPAEYHQALVHWTVYEAYLRNGEEGDMAKAMVELGRYKEILAEARVKALIHRGGRGAPRARWSNV